MEGIKHLVECHCVLPQLKGSKNITYHKFVVFSIIDDSDTVIPKNAKCNNCGVIHNVVDICKSEIEVGFEANAVITKEDIKLMIPSDLSSILETYDCDIATWENALFLYENNIYDKKIVISRTEEENKIFGKLLKITNNKIFRIEPYSYSLVV
mgnify:CR=1 FL=1